MPHGEHETQRPYGARETRAASLLDQAGYTVIPRSGTFRGVARQLDGRPAVYSNKDIIVSNRKIADDFLHTVSKRG